MELVHFYVKKQLNIDDSFFPQLKNYNSILK